MVSGKVELISTRGAVKILTATRQFEEFFQRVWDSLEEEWSE